MKAHKGVKKACPTALRVIDSAPRATLLRTNERSLVCQREAEVKRDTEHMGTGSQI